MSERDLLIEIGTEELPPKALLPLSTAFATTFERLLAEAGLSHAGVEPYATPRRLALLVRSLHERQADSVVEKFGPALQAAFDAEGKPTKAAEGFARGCGVEVSALQQADDGKVRKLVFRATRPGQDSVSLIPDMVKQALAELPIPKRMRWGSSREEFVRPVHWVVLLFGDQVIDAEILGVATGRITYGHRFHHPAPLTLASPQQYVDILLDKGSVIASFSQRKAKIRALVEEQGRLHQARAVIEEALLDEVTSLVEWPVALCGNFNQSFLAVPMEALVSSMKGHQKCFYLVDDKGNILPHFITISNLKSKDPAQVIAGNEKVIRPRLADAAFFYDQDRKHSLAVRREKLKTVVFQQQLGTLHDKSERVSALARHIAHAIGADPALAQRAASLGKCDLMTSMVYEFAELQGIMGYYYALNDGEPEEVAMALNEQYLPRFAGDELPTTRTGVVLALAERLDTMVGLFGIGQPPTGSKDPFALRRAALGVLRILIEKQIDLDLADCVREAARNFDGLPAEQGLVDSVLDFIFERLRAWYTDQGIGVDVFLAVDALRATNPHEFDLRIKAVDRFRQLPQAQSLAAANKRVSNILAKLEQAPAGQVDQALLRESAEQTLFQALGQQLSHASPLFGARQYTEALESLASLQQPVDAFFDQVMVNTEDEATRHNRLALLQQLRQLFLKIADISLLQGS